MILRKLLPIIIASLGLLPHPTSAREVRTLVFTSFRDGNAEIYRVDSDGKNLHNLTNNSAEDLHPTWSPDGTKIVFVSNRDGDAHWSLYQMDADGTNLKALVSSESPIEEPLFSPDGSQISYITITGNRGAETVHDMIMSSAGQHPVNLADNIYHLAWAPDGQHLFGRGYWDPFLHSIAVSSGETTKYDGFTIGSFSLSADGSRLAYDYGGEFSVIILRDLVNGHEVKLPGVSPDAEITDFGAQWSPAGSQLAYVTKMGSGVYDVYITGPDPSVTPHLLYDEDSFQTMDPVWSPDSEQVAFIGAHGELDENALDATAFDIYVADVNGTHTVNISNHPARDVEPVWQPTAQ